MADFKGLAIGRGPYHPTMHFVHHHAPDAQRLAQALADWVAARLNEALAGRGQALLVISGGSTPVPFFQALSRAELPWARVTVLLADEREVPGDHPDSNSRLVRTHLLQGLAAMAKWVDWARPDGPEAPPHAAREAVLAQLPWPADVVVLGMGGDGHTASLFPHAPELALALDTERPERCIAVSAPALPNVPVPRWSLTARALLDTRALVIHVTGAAKLTLLQLALMPGEASEWPIRLALHQRQVPCHVFQAD